MRIAVLGCGPAGLLAAHAGKVYGHDVRVYSKRKRRKSHMFGAQFLHADIPYLAWRTNQPKANVQYVLQGTAEAYRKKVYGDVRVPVSPEEMQGVRPAWDIRWAYDRLWKMWEPYITHVEFPNSNLVRTLLEHFDKVFSSIPAPVLCMRIPEGRDLTLRPATGEMHAFRTQRVYAIGDAPALGVKAPVIAPPNTVICNGNKEPGWYRAANIFGYNTVEWPGTTMPPLDDVAEVLKPLATDCDCWPGIYRIGRYGKWKKGELVHSVYEEVARECKM